MSNLRCEWRAQSGTDVDLAISTGAEAGPIGDFVVDWALSEVLGDGDITPVSNALVP